MLLKGPTGCGKTRFVEYMAWKLGRPLTIVKDKGARRRSGDGAFQALPLITVACHEDLTASDLVGRYLLEGDSTRWIDGPLTRAVKVGAICYLDEVVEARKDTTVLIHPLTDHRRVLPIEKRGQILEAREGFLLVISYNPGYQSALKDLKHSTRQRFISIEFTHPRKELEAKIIAHESGVSEDDRGGPGEAGREGAQPARARPERRRQHAPARLHRQADPRRASRRGAPARSASSGRSPTTWTCSAASRKSSAASSSSARPSTTYAPARIAPMRMRAAPSAIVLPLRPEADMR